MHKLYFILYAIFICYMLYFFSRIILFVTFLLQLNVLLHFVMPSVTLKSQLWKVIRNVFKINKKVKELFANIFIEEHIGTHPSGTLCPDSLQLILSFSSFLLFLSSHRCSCSHAWHALHTWIARFSISYELGLLRIQLRDDTHHVSSSRRLDPTRVAPIPCTSFSTWEVASHCVIKIITQIIITTNKLYSINVCSKFWLCDTQL